MRPFFLFLLSCFAASPTFAGLTFCNETGHQASVAIGYKDGSAWTSEGWWTVASGDCTTALGTDLANRYYYYRVTSPDITYPTENYYFCTSPKVFTIVGDTECEARGYDRSPFNELDVGEARDWTVTLTSTDATKTKQPGRETGSAPAYSEVHSALQGFWKDADDADIGMRIEDDQLTDYFLDIAGGSATWSLVDTCQGANRAGPAMIVTYDDFPDEPLCWVLLGLNEKEFRFRAVGGTSDVRMVKQ